MKLIERTEVVEMAEDAAAFFRTLQAEGLSVATAVTLTAELVAGMTTTAIAVSGAEDPWDELARGWEDHPGDDGEVGTS